jgi:hypothetical protein
MITTRRLTAVLLVIAASGGTAPLASHDGLDQVTVPLLVEGNRPFVEVTFAGATARTNPLSARRNRVFDMDRGRVRDRWDER